MSLSPKGALQQSPGRRPGSTQECISILLALKGRHRNLAVIPLQPKFEIGSSALSGLGTSLGAPADPGRWPGLCSVAPLGLSISPWRQAPSRSAGLSPRLPSGEGRGGGELGGGVRSIRLNPLGDSRNCRTQAAAPAKPGRVGRRAQGLTRGRGQQKRGESPDLLRVMYPCGILGGRTWRAPSRKPFTLKPPRLPSWSAQLQTRPIAVRVVRPAPHQEVAFRALGRLGGTSSRSRACGHGSCRY